MNANLQEGGDEKNTFFLAFSLQKMLRNEAWQTGTFVLSSFKTVYLIVKSLCLRLPSSSTLGLPRLHCVISK